MYIELINELTKEIIEGARRYAEKVGITQGAVVVSFEILSDEVGEEIPLGPYRSEVVFSEPLIKGGKDTFYRIEGKPEGDCATVAKQKISSAKRAFLYYSKGEPFFPEYPQKFMSGSLSPEFLGNGRTPWKGGVYIPVGYPGRCGCALVWAGDVMGLGVAISGGTQVQDEDGIKEMFPAIRHIIRKYGLLIPKAFP